jgi:hypothetical protein
MTSYIPVKRNETIVIQSYYEAIYTTIEIFHEAANNAKRTLFTDKLIMIKCSLLK